MEQQPANLLRSVCHRFDRLRVLSCIDATLRNFMIVLMLVKVPLNVSMSLAVNGGACGPTKHVEQLSLRGAYLNELKSRPFIPCTSQIVPFNNTMPATLHETDRQGNRSSGVDYHALYFPLSPSKDKTAFLQ